MDHGVRSSSVTSIVLRISDYQENKTTCMKEVD